MASYHFTMKSSADTKATADMRADYVCREGKYAQGSKAEELLYKEHCNMPEWAKDNPRSFWEASEMYERANGTTFREIEFALPNELALEQQKSLVADFVTEHLGKEFVYSYGIHSKSASLAYGIENPHAHIVFCERRLDGIERTKEQFFKRYNSRFPERGGARKDSRWNDKERNKHLEFLRARFADLQNAHLERAGLEVRVDHRSKEVQFQEAVALGDLDKAHVLDRPAEKHVGPKQASKVARELRELTHNVGNAAERNELRRQYWDIKASGEQNEKVYQMRQIRVLDKVMEQLHEQDHKRGPAREANAGAVAAKMYWYAKRKELQGMRSKLNIEKYRLLRAEQKSYDPARLQLWKRHYEKRLLEWEALQYKVKNEILDEDDRKKIQVIAQGIQKVESDKRISKEWQMPPSSSAVSMKNAVTVAALQIIVQQRVTEIHASLESLRKQEALLKRKKYTLQKAQRIAEWRISQGTVAGIVRAEKELMQEKKKYLEACKAHETLQESGNVQLTVWKNQMDKRQQAIKVRRKNWDVEKQQPHIAEKIHALRDKILRKNTGIEKQITQVRLQIEALRQERSEWNKIGYSILQVKNLEQQVYLTETAQGPREILQQAPSIQSQLRRSVQHLREERPQGRVGVRLQVNDEIPSTKTSEQDMDR